ncbi:MAG: hypothetical protein ABH832_02000 [bacterium]
MPDQNQQPTILVKKADGTTERMTLDQVRKMKEETSVPQPAKPMPNPAKQIVPQPSNPAPQPVKLGQQPAKPDPQPAKQVAPQPAKVALFKKPVDQNILAQESQVLNNVDYSSPLQEKVDSKFSHLPLASNDRLGQVSEIMKKIKIEVTPDNRNRLRTIVQLGLKGVRDKNQTMGSLIRPVLEGGMALDDEQAKNILDLIDQSINKSAIVPDLDDFPVAYKEPQLPARSTPFNSFKHSDITKTTTPKIVDQIIKNEQKNAPLDKLELNSQRLQTKVIHDIVEQPREMGPVDEIQYFTLEDFRRLSDDPNQSAGRLKQKLINLKDESYLLYLDGLEALKRSPFYLNYMESVSKAFLSRQKLEIAIATGAKDRNGDITLAEIQAIVNMENEL